MIWLRWKHRAEKGHTGNEDAPGRVRPRLTPESKPDIVERILEEHRPPQLPPQAVGR